MDELIRKLQANLQDHPNNNDLRDTISYLQSSIKGKPLPESTWDTLQKKLDALREQGLGLARDEEEHALREFRVTLQSHEGYHRSPSVAEAKEDANQFPARPSETATRLPFSFATPTALPVELYGLLDQAYRLHVLATDPHSILPPGKSILSALSRSHSENAHRASELQNRVEGMIHKAFWNGALEALSDPSPPVQLPRLKRLYQDMYEALSSILPAKHPVLVTLSFPLSPTSSPLHSVITHLREILQSLKERCAPARDPQIDALMNALNDPPDGTLPRLIIDTVRSILKLADVMKDDLSQFVLGSMSEKQLRDVIARQAATREREMVLQLWSSPKLRDLWKQWLDETSPMPHSDASPISARDKFIRRLLQALGTNQAVSCNLPTITVNMNPDEVASPAPDTPDASPTPSNTLPPPLLFITPSLFYVQNYLQALVITASLRALVRIPPNNTSAHTSEAKDLSEDSFLRRIWTLLKSDIDGEPSEVDLKVVNLADEVVRISGLYGGKLDSPDAPGSGDEARLRQAVDRTLKPTDPVFLLLQKRLVQAIATHLITHAPHQKQGAPNGVPVEMHTGRAVKRPRMNVDVDGDGSASLNLEFPKEVLVVKGFESPVLSEAVSDVVARLRKCIAWTEFVWGDLFEVAIDSA